MYFYVMIWETELSYITSNRKINCTVVFIYLHTFLGCHAYAFPQIHIYVRFYQRLL